MSVAIALAVFGTSAGAASWAVTNGPHRTTPTATAASVPAALSFQNSGLDAGSTIPTIAADPKGSGVLLAGSNVGGVYRSVNRGATWAPANTGLTVGGLSLASLMYSPTVPGKVYAALGNKGPGGVEVSTDGGQTWTVQSTAPQFNGRNPYTTTMPSGRMLAPASNGVLYAATTNAGVMRSTDDGKTWTTIGLPTASGAALRGIIVNPTNPDNVYVANFGGSANANFPSGLYVSTNATSASPTFTAVQGAPTDVEDLTIVGLNLYVAANDQGVWSTPVGLPVWRQLITPNFALWASIEGVQPAGQVLPTLYAGAAKPRANGAGAYTSIQKSTDGGLTWSAVTTSASVHLTEGGPTGASWWLASYHPEMMLGQPSYIPRQIAIDPVNPTNVAVTGRVDVWSTGDGGTNWYPAVRGIGSTVERSVVADPNREGTAYATGYDWGLVGSTDGMRTVKGISPAFATITAALDVALDTATTPSSVYVAGFNQFNPSTTSDVFTSADPMGGKPWSSLGLAQVTGGASVYGVTVRRVVGASGVPQPVVLAAVGVGAGKTCSTECGVWRKAGSSAWTRVAGPMSAPEGGFHASFAWSTASAPVYLFDPGTGLWRSKDAGVTWTRIWNRPLNNDMTGFIAAPLASPGVVYVSLGTLGVHRLTGADTGTAVGNGITDATVGSFTGAGPMTVSADGTLWVAQVSPFGTGLWRSMDSGATWASVDDATYRNMAFFPTGVAVSPLGQVLVSTRGDGVVVSSNYQQTPVNP